MDWRVSASKPTPPAITRRWRCEFRGIPAPRSMRHTMGDGSPHAVEPIHQIAVVVIPVPKVEHEHNNQRGHEYAHLTSLLPAVQVRQPPGRPASVYRSSVCRSCALRAKNDRRSLEVRRPSFGRTPKRRSGRPPPRRDFTCTFRAEPRRQAVRDAAHPQSTTRYEL